MNGVMRTRLTTTAQALGGCAFALAGFSVLAAPSEVGPLVLCAFLLMGGAGAVLAIRGFRAGLLLRDEVLVIRGYLRTRSVPWEDIRGFSVEPGVTVLPWSSLVVERSSAPITVPEVASLGRPNGRLKVERICAQLQGELAGRSHR